jgi:hypothetical protein
LFLYASLQILEEQQSLFFHLQQQRLIELIRQGKTEQALAFAQEYLAPHGEENEAFLEELGALLRCLHCNDSWAVMLYKSSYLVPEVQDVITSS